MSKRWKVDAERFLSVAEEYIASAVVERTRKQSERIEELENALRDSAKGLESIQRNVDVLKQALFVASVPSAWLDGIAPKLARAKDALREEP